MNFANNHKDNVIKAVLIFAVSIVSFLSWRSTVALWGGGESTDIMQKEDATTITKCMVWVLHKHYRDLCTGPIDDQTRYYEISKAFFYFLTTQYAEGFFSRDIDDAVIEGVAGITQSNHLNYLDVRRYIETNVCPVHSSDIAETKLSSMFKISKKPWGAVFTDDMWNRLIGEFQLFLTGQGRPAKLRNPDLLHDLVKGKRYARYKFLFKMWNDFVKSKCRIIACNESDESRLDLAYKELGQILALKYWFTVNKHLYCPFANSYICVNFPQNTPSLYCRCRIVLNAAFVDNLMLAEVGLPGFTLNDRFGLIVSVLHR